MIIKDTIPENIEDNTTANKGRNSQGRYLTPNLINSQKPKPE